MRMIAILCAAAKTAYRDLPEVEIYDAARDAWSFQGDMPVIAHPPCRHWSAYCSHQAGGDRDSEMRLGLWCAEQVQRCGGILEQPAHSRLWAAAGLPLPGSPQSPDSYSLAVWGAWWGHPTRKATWLYFRRVSEFDIHIPFRLHVGDDRRRWQLQGSAGRRSHTPPALARWLADLTRTVSIPIAEHGCPKP